MSRRIKKVMRIGQRLATVSATFIPEERDLGPYSDIIYNPEERYLGPNPEVISNPEDEEASDPFLLSSYPHIPNAFLFQPERF